MTLRERIELIRSGFIDEAETGYIIGTLLESARSMLGYDYDSQIETILSIAEEIVKESVELAEDADEFDRIISEELYGFIFRNRKPTKKEYCQSVGEIYEDDTPQKGETLEARVQRLERLVERQQDQITKLFNPEHDY